MSASRKKAAGILFILVLIGLWQLLAVFIGKSYILPSPAKVIVHLIENRAEIFTVQLPATMYVVAIGLSLSIILGFIFAVIMDASATIEKMLYPILTVSQTIPTMCIAPILVLWMGYGSAMRIVVVVLVNFFSVTVNVFDGLKATSDLHTELMHTFGAGRLQSFFLLRLPTALPNFFTALKIAIPWSMIGAAVAEWLGAPAGLGMYSRKCMMSLDAAGLLAPLLVLTVLAVILNGILIFIIQIRNFHG